MVTVLKVVCMRIYILHKIFSILSCFIDNVCYKWCFYLFSKTLYKQIKQDNIETFKKNLPFPNKELVLYYGKYDLFKTKNVYLYDFITRFNYKKAIIIYCENDKEDFIYYNQQCHFMFLYKDCIYDNECFFIRKITKDDNNLFCRFIFYN